MSDLVDRANDVAQQELEHVLAQAALPAPTPITECVDCDEPIGAIRKQKVPHAVRCVDCAELVETRG